MVDLVVSAEQQQIVDSVVEYLVAELPLGRLRPGQPGSDAEHWPRMGALGWFMLAVPGAQGGVGLSAVEEALLFRQLGRHLLSPNVLASVIGVRVAAHAGVSDLASAIMSGEARVALAQATGRPNVGARVKGRFHLFDADGADWILFVHENGAAALVARPDIGDVWRVASAVDGITVDVATVDAAAHLHTGAQSGAAITLRLLAAAMLAGVCDGTRDLATAYAGVREQFGQPIGAFQAIKHKCADMALRAEAVGSLLSFASIAVASGRPDAAFQATAAKLLGGQYALLSAKETIQVHGGIGFTVECDAHHFLKRAHVYDQIGGASRRQQQLLLAESAPPQEAVA